MNSDSKENKTTIDESQHDPSLIEHWNNLKYRPRIIVFDLDYTLWPYFMDCHVVPPIKSTINNNIQDARGTEYKAFDDVTRILRTLKEKCLDDDGHLAIASRSSTTDLAMQGIRIYGWEKYLSSFQIYPKIKNIHMKEIKNELKFDDFTDVLFFDDEQYNYKPTAQLGVVPFIITKKYGLSMEAMFEGLKCFEAKKAAHHKNV